MRLVGTLLTAAAVTAAGMAAAPAQAAPPRPAEGRVLGVDAAGAIPGQYIVTLKTPRNLTGPWYVFVLTDPPTQTSPRGAVFEGNAELNNATATTRRSINP